MTRPTPALLPLCLALGCAPVEETAAPPADPGPVGDAWRAVQPEGLLDLVESTDAAVPQGLTCPAIDFVDGEEVWLGGCAMLDGTLVEGRLTRSRDVDTTWLVGESFAVTRPDGHVDLFLDGAIAVQDDGALLAMDVAATTCGAHVDCDDGAVSLDLRYALLLPDDEPLAADASVRGFVAVGDREPVAVEGAWRVDGATCDLEPVDGIFAVQGERRQTLEHDGADRCDGCAAWTVQGQDAPAWCPTVD